MTWTLVNLFLVLNVMRFCTAICENKEETHTNHEIAQYDDEYGLVPERHTKSLINLTVTCQELELPLIWTEDSAVDYDCDNCPKVVIIFNSNISIIPSSAFVGLSSFTVLRISNVYLERLKPGAFNYLHSLKELYLSDNKLSVIGTGIFNSLTNLEILDLSINELVNIDVDSLTGLTNLRELKMSSNRLVSFESVILDQNVLLLEYVDLSFNLLKHIDIRTVSNKIKNMDLSVNNINELNFCPFELESLIISRNNITFLEKLHCSAAFRIIHFDASYNTISELNSSLLLNLTHLEYLNLAYNNISLIPTGLFLDMNNLKNLNLSHNQLHEFQHGTFEHLENLRILDLSYNKISTLKRFLHSLVNLQKLYIKGNRIFFLDGEQLLTDFPKLSFISLDNNIFSCSTLISVIDSFRQGGVYVEYGKAKTISNIHGISCFDDEKSEISSTKASIDDVNSKFDNFLSKLQKLMNGDLKKSIVSDYFNNEFKNSSFYKYLESFHRIDLPKPNETILFNFFNDGFKNNKFYKYLEGLKNNENFTNDFNKRFFDNFDKGLKNGDMYNFFNKNFINSSFYEYLESLKNSRSSVSAGESSEAVSVNANRDLLITIAIFLVAIFLVMIGFVFIDSRRKLQRNIQRVELLES